MEFPRSAEIVREGDAPRGLYVVTKGRVVLTRRGESGSQSQILRVIGAGETVGAMAALAETPYDVTARALEAVEVLCVPEERLLEFYQAAPALGLAL
ncbi:MAG: cyclic nucleotide-binding domain-containing protein, partial [Dehalococcoidia bacterium]